MALKPADLLKYGPLLMKYGHVKSADVTAELIAEIAGAANLPINMEVIPGLVDMMRKSDLDNLAEWMSTPERLNSVLATLKGQPQSKGGTVMVCRHCGELQYFE